MLHINYIPPTHLFTSQIPSQITILADQSAVNITVKSEDKEIFTTTLYTYNQKATLYDLRSIIESNIEQQNTAFANFSIYANTTTDSTNTNSCCFIYARCNINDITAFDYIQKHFLTTLSSYTIPRSAVQELTFCLLPGQTLKSYTECLVQKNGESIPQTFIVDEGNITGADKISLQTVTISPQQLLKKVDISGKLLSFTIHRGAIAKTFYVIDKEPNLQLLVCNEFNCIEYIYLNCVTRRKLDLDRSTVTSLGSESFYDDKSTFEHEVESSMLSLEEASRLAILLLSHNINIAEGEDNNIPIIITDLSSEISDADNATNSIKFKYKYAQQMFPVALKPTSNIFSHTFNPTFD